MEYEIRKFLPNYNLFKHFFIRYSLNFIPYFIILQTYVYKKFVMFFLFLFPSLLGKW